MLLKLSGAGTLQQQLTSAIKLALQTGRLKIGARMPATRDLARELGLSRNTVRNVYDQLIAEGYLEGQARKGSFVVQTGVAPLRPRLVVQAAAPSAFARRVRRIEASEIPRENEKLRYNFFYGLAAHDSLLIRAWRRELSKAAVSIPPRYRAAHGLPELRSAICDYLSRRRGISCTADDVVIVSGTQQALSLCAQVLIDIGDKVALEDPHYFSARHVFEAAGAKLSFIPVDSSGIAVRTVVRQRPKAVLVTPSHQFPSGSVLSLSRRLELLSFANNNAAWIIEDDYDSEFRFDAKPLPALRALDSLDQVIYMGSFSKVISPALRLGYLVVPSALRNDFRSAKRLSDLGSPTVDQAAMAQFMLSGSFDRHLRRVVSLVRSRRETLVECLLKLGPDKVQFEDSRAGMHLVAWLPSCSHKQLKQLIALAANQGVGLYSISQAYKTPPPRPGLLLGYASLNERSIVAGMDKFAKCLHQILRG